MNAIATPSALSRVRPPLARRFLIVRRSLLGLIVMALPALAGAASTLFEDFADGTANGFNGSSTKYSIPTTGVYAYTYFNSTTTSDQSLVTTSGYTWQKNFRLRASVRNLGTTSAHKAGVIYQYVNSTNYYKLLIDAVGNWQLIERTGQATEPAAVLTGSYPGGGGNDEWAEFEIIKNDSNQTSIWINGQRIVDLRSQTLGAGQIGVCDVGTTARYDNLSVTPIPAVVYLEDLSNNLAEGWTLPTANWTVANGIIDRDNSTDGTTSAQEIAFYGTTSYSGDYTASASVWLRYNSSGNEAGFVYNYTDGSHYSEVLINSSGRVRLLRANGGSPASLTTTTATSYYGQGNKRWHDITVIRKGGLTTVNINGKRVYTDISGDASSGKVGVVANWNRARFDDIVVYDGIYPYKRTFPKLAAIYNSGSFNYDDDAIAAIIAKFDLAMLGIYKGWHSNGADVALTKIKSPVVGNPAILLGTYLNVMESTNTANNTSQAGNVSTNSQWDLYQKLSNADGTGAVGPGGNPTSPAHNDWWAHEPAGTYFIKEYKGTGMTNITYKVTPDSYGYRYPQWYAERCSELMLSITNKYDFVFEDNVFYQPRGQYDEDGNSSTPNLGAPVGTNPDWDRNGSQDTPSSSATIYRQGLATLAMKLGQLRPDLFLMGNIDGSLSAGHLRDPEYQRLLPSALFESAFGRNYSSERWNHWTGMMSLYHSHMINSAEPHISVLQSKGTAAGDPTYNPTDTGHPFATGNQSFMRYSLASALMEDGYLAYGDVDAYDSGGVWFAEFDVLLGHPIDGPQGTAAAWNGTTYRRRFQNGTVWVNQRETSSGAAGTVLNYTVPSGEGPYKDIAGNPVTSFTLQPGDGLVLLLAQ